ncbi:class E sortase [Actinomycetospora straminea]|uniref:class E sortase n=1 Tax=Actinomycetospora straminea TaxID=663607 RepID=UPI002365F536|nr:class E sortase [Actinomycetospora straminea]MDD7933899.1 class E sortase [Actinomycetospora straminea]
MIRGLAEVLLTLGVVLVLYVVHELYGTAVTARSAQASASAALDDAWRAPVAAPPVVGEPIARLRIPAFGPDWSYAVVEGTDRPELAAGVGHYAGTPLPGQPGNVGLAGHRVTHGAPFDGLGTLRSCDAVVVETRDARLTYRVLPLASEVRAWPRERARRAECADVAAPEGVYAGLTGREVVRPTETSVLDTVPGRPAEAPASPQRLLTLTTCHPRFSARERLVVHAVLTETAPRSGREES